MPDETPDDAQQRRLKRLSTVHHEAGHAVAYVLAGGRVQALELLPVGGHMIPADVDKTKKSNLPGVLVALLAGMAAEVRALVGSGVSESAAREYAEVGGKSDSQTFGEYSRGSGLRKGQVAGMAEDLVSRYFGWITKLANRLDKAGRLSGKKVHAILKGMVRVAKSNVRTMRGRKPARDVNFAPKRERKAVRKSMIRAALANKVADVRSGARERAEFYKNLRQLKMARRSIAAEMAKLAVMTSGLMDEVRHVEARYPDGVPLGLLDETALLAKNAHASMSTAADEMATFAKKKVLFTEAVAA